MQFPAVLAEPLQGPAALGHTKELRWLGPYLLPQLLQYCTRPCKTRVGVRKSVVCLIPKCVPSMENVEHVKVYPSLWGPKRYLRCTESVL